MVDFDNLHIIGQVDKSSTNTTHIVTPFDLDFRFKPEVEQFHDFLSLKLRNIST